MTLSTYSHLFDAHEHAARMAAILKDGFGGTLAAMGPEPHFALVAG